MPPSGWKVRMIDPAKLDRLAVEARAAAVQGETAETDAAGDPLRRLLRRNHFQMHLVEMGTFRVPGTHAACRHVQVDLSFLPGGQGNGIFPVGDAVPVGIFQSNSQLARRLRSCRIAKGHETSQGTRLEIARQFRLEMEIRDMHGLGGMQEGRTVQAGELQGVPGHVQLYAAVRADTNAPPRRAPFPGAAQSVTSTSVRVKPLHCSPTTLPSQ